MKDTTNRMPSIEEVAKFHGHICPGLVIGYRAAEYFLGWLDDRRAEDEEIIAIVENRACGIDAIQYMLGTTAGKGNFFINDYGKHIYVAGNRKTGKALRLAVNSSNRQKVENETREKRIKRMLCMSLDDLFEAREVDIEFPKPAQVLQTIICDSCGEGAMETKIRIYKGDRLCIPCFEQKSGLNAHK
ncbi:MAG: TraR/DksA C4-type zinc finger protein [Rubrobacteridae bacterium]|nr:TraR/DksA C4-type zinc finger protein [Rubrobacteridae bacterium]